MTTLLREKYFFLPKSILSVPDSDWKCFPTHPRLTVFLHRICHFRGQAGLMRRTMISLLYASQILAWRSHSICIYKSHLLVKQLTLQCPVSTYSPRSVLNTFCPPSPHQYLSFPFLCCFQLGFWHSCSQGLGVWEGTRHSLPAPPAVPGKSRDLANGSISHGIHSVPKETVIEVLGNGHEIGWENTEYTQIW